MDESLAGRSSGGLASETYANLKAEKSFLIETQETEADEIASIVKWLARIA